MVATVVAAGLSGWMFIGSLGSSGLPGCGAGSACDAVTKGRWGRWGRFPVAGMGVGLYVFFFAVELWQCGMPATSNAQLRSALLQTLALLAAGAALWFIALQSIVIRRLCAYCMAIHICGLLAAFLILYLRSTSVSNVVGAPLAIAGAGLAILIGGQILLTPKTYDIIPPSPPVSQEPPNPIEIPTPSPPRAVQPSNGGMCSLHGGRVKLDSSRFPHIGPADAPYAIGFLMDYTCSECHHLHRLLYEAIDHYAGQLAVIPILVPLNKVCNPAIDCPRQENPQACAYARLSLAVWNSGPAGYEEWDRYMAAEQETQPFGLALAKAKAINNIDNFQMRESDAVLDPQIAECIAIYKAAGKPKLPCLLLTNGALVGRVPSKESLLQLLDKHLFGQHAV